MVAARDNAPKFTTVEYFAWEERQLCRHEYIDGEVYAMSGGTINHSEISGNFLFMLKGYLEDSGCKTLNSDARVNIVETNDYTYPDVSVTCDQRDRTQSQYITYPCLVAKILSDSTEAYDRGNKFFRYRRNPCLRDYVLISSQEIAIDLYRKNDVGEWIIINYRAGDLVELHSVDFSFPIERVYRGISFEPEST